MNSNAEPFPSVTRGADTMTGTNTLPLAELQSKCRNRGGQIVDTTDERGGYDADTTARFQSVLVAYGLDGWNSQTETFCQSLVGGTAWSVNFTYGADETDHDPREGIVLFDRVVPDSVEDVS